MTIRVGDLTEKEIIGCDPDVYLKNGLVAAILDAIREGLSEPRGIKISEATENAGNKAHQAKNVIEGMSQIEKLKELVLAITPSGGEA